jgi:hypothetical protein
LIIFENGVELTIFEWSGAKVFGMEWSKIFEWSGRYRWVVAFSHGPSVRVLWQVFSNPQQHTTYASSQAVHIVVVRCLDDTTEPAATNPP